MDKLLNKYGWKFGGYCGTCRVQLEQWTNPNRKGETFKISRAAGFFYHYRGSVVVKSDYTQNINKYLTKLHENDTAEKTEK